ncbi:hypothetical protein V3C99_015500 [Haemonchus contortus]
MFGDIGPYSKSLLLLLIPTVSAHLFPSQPCATPPTSSCGSSYGVYRAPVTNYGVPSFPQTPVVVYPTPLQYAPQQPVPPIIRPLPPPPPLLQPPPPPPPPQPMTYVPQPNTIQAYRGYIGPALPPQSPPPPVYITPAPVYVTTPSPPICWMDEDGFECCSIPLQTLMRDFLNSQQVPRGCNMQKVANQLQMMAQNHFNFSFESTVAQSQMASKFQFRARLMCKVRSNDGKIALLFATPNQYSLEPSEYHPLTPLEEEGKGWTETEKEIWSSDDPRLFTANLGSKSSKV